MTDTLEAEVSDGVRAASADPQRDRRRRRTLAWVGVVGLAAVGALAWMAWNGVTSSAFDGVSLQYDTAPIVCDGAVVESIPSVENAGFSQTSVVMTEGMTCELRIQVVNDGWAEVDLESVTLTGLAPDNMLQLDVEFVNPNAQRGEVAEGDYVFPLPGGYPVAPGSIDTVAAVLSYDGGAVLGPCSAQGWRIPTVTVTAFGQSRVLGSPPHSDIWFRNGSLAECGP